MAFKKIRQFNRKKNIFLKKIKLNAKLFFLDKKSRAEPVVLPEKMDIIILCNAFGIGDAIIMTGLVNALHQHGHRITMLCEKRTAFIFAESPLVADVIVFDTLADLSQVENAHFDLLIDINEKNHLSPLRFKIIKALGPKISLGINQGKYKIYDDSIDYHHPVTHTSIRHKQVLKHLGIANEEYRYTLTIPHSAEKATEDFISSLKPGKRVVINPFATELSRDMSAKQIEDISHYLEHTAGYSVIFIGTPQQLARIHSSSGVKFSSPSFLHAAALIKAADLVISPDTSVVHLCKVYNKKLICLYNNKVYGEGYQNNIVWGPDYDNATQILSPGTRIDDIPSATLIAAIEKI